MSWFSKQCTVAAIKENSYKESRNCRSVGKKIDVQYSYIDYKIPYVKALNQDFLLLFHCLSSFKVAPLYKRTSSN